VHNPESEKVAGLVNW